MEKSTHSILRRIAFMGNYMQPEDQDVALLPRRIDGDWALIHRPVSANRADMWISYSPDWRN